jgi:hypothetical protein
MRTPAEIEAAWAAAKNGVVDQEGGAETAPTVLVVKHADPGLSEARTETVQTNHQHLLLKNNNAA